MPPLISIIIPVYNHAHTLKRCLKSIEEQTYRPLDVIIVDDGSKDNFNEIISQISLPLERGSQRIIYKIFHQENKGASAARNRGLKEANGEYLVCWDADTIGKPQMLEKLERQLQNYPQASYAYSQFRFGWKTMKSQPFNNDDLKRYNYIDTTSLIRRKDFPPSGWDESLRRFQDWDIWLTLLGQGKVGIFVSEVLYGKLVIGRKGISSWVPSFAYKLPWFSRKVQAYKSARDIILKKHHLFN